MLSGPQLLILNARIQEALKMESFHNACESKRDLTWTHLAAEPFLHGCEAIYSHFFIRLVQIIIYFTAEALMLDYGMPTQILFRVLPS